MSPFHSQYINDGVKPPIVEWTEDVYEEYLIERVRSKYDNFRIGLVVDFRPTIRRLTRIRKLLEQV